MAFSGARTPSGGASGPPGDTEAPEEPEDRIAAAPAAEETSEETPEEKGPEEKAPESKPADDSPTKDKRTSDEPEADEPADTADEDPARERDVAAADEPEAETPAVPDKPEAEESSDRTTVLRTDVVRARADKPEAEDSADAPDTATPADAKPGESDEADAEPADAKPATKPSDDKPSDDKPAATKPSDDEPSSDKDDKADEQPSVAAEDEAEAVRTQALRSEFVPLRSSDDPPSAPAARPTPPPPGPPVPEADATRQQPLPPVPGQRAIDLLAELTNKPAPPETPLRTLVRRVKIWTPLVLLLVLVFVSVQLLRPLPAPALELTASPTHVFDGGKPAIAWPDSGQAALGVEGLGSFGTSGEQKPVPIASVAKTMTAYLLLRDHPMKEGEDGKKIPVDKKAEDDAGLSAQGESTVDVKEGETLTQREALNAIMIASANNVARLVARWDSGSEEKFVEKMNATADELGMKNTTYTDPSGLLKETVSTAEDQVKLGRAAMKLPAFRESVRLPSYVDRNGKKQDNWNRLVPLFGTIGIKTGTTTAAGGNLLFAAEKEIGGTKQLIIGAVLSQHRPPIIDSVLAAAKELILSAQEALESETVIKKGTVVGVVDDGLGGRTDVVVTEDVEAVGWSGLKVRLALSEGRDGVPGEAPKGTKVGTLTVGAGQGQVKVPVALDGELVEPGSGARLARVG
ncbi:D-alanyl-D-alanine carboxypeptidase [Streptomyces durbertensis]|uniref:D-alanyl-D-alanine carboxypeptidase n=2 Tax=Streptomyces durbertensis TaxID=2448886 RepID=A0ABR6EDQ9_9ACTN|nr:D-alanyl-D-alanine carboxypeptidase [Streptomyces durbertensis]